MAFQEALDLILEHYKPLPENINLIEMSPTTAALKYLFDCYNRIEVEERQYPKVKIVLFIIIICSNQLFCF